MSPSSRRRGRRDLPKLISARFERSSRATRPTFPAALRGCRFCLDVNVVDSLRRTEPEFVREFLDVTGMDPKTEYHANVGRPITLIRDGSTIPGLFS